MFNLIVAQVDKTYFDGVATSLTCPCVSGEVTILAHHAPLVAVLKKGVLRIRDEEGTEITVPIESGVLEVGLNQATVLL